jgi:hypothetical protein
MLGLSTTSLIQYRQGQTATRQRIINAFGKSFDFQCQYIFPILEIHLQYVREDTEN